ncbi:dioxygenase [Noviherbaspirillum denitrificans]|uniref:Catechol 1,2-dioxygenase n=1 Tax=Noviherbaspirillum denitrificans TaxID=1968433 RepID=A0A254TEW8_9BURK|nr:dioxygenase [Noviherbaspirillum denitrificans]OWW21180.1 catechol 1,2-dioxygenase [Noviherbaspirillum denitrificans]
MGNKKIIDTEASITPIVLDALTRTEDARLRELLVAFVRHAHALIREVNLTQEEFDAALRFIGAIGQANTELHNEVVLAADVLGISTLVALRNNPTDHGQTAAALLGPFWRLNAPDCGCGESIARSNTPGAPMYVAGQVRSVNGQPIAGAVVDVWQASPVGLYENQDPEQEEMNLRGKFRTNENGSYHFYSVCPAGYPVPTHGPVGGLLEAIGRHPYRPAHVHFMVSAPGYKTLITQVFADNSEHLESDVVFGVTKHLIGHFKRNDTPNPELPAMKPPFYTLNYDFVLEEGEQSFPEPPIK